MTVAAPVGFMTAVWPHRWLEPLRPPPRLPGSGRERRPARRAADEIEERMNMLGAERAGWRAGY